jgi:hypothetical protein
MAEMEFKQVGPSCKDEAADRISVDEVFHLMLPRFEPHAARVRLDTGIQANEVRLWCDDALISPDFFSAMLRVAARPEADGRWIAWIEATRALQKPEKEYVWTMSRAEIVERLLRKVQAKPCALLDATAPIDTTASLIEEKINKLRPQKWLEGEARRMKRDGEITQEMEETKRVFAEALFNNMQAAYKRGEVRKLLTSPQYISNSLTAWGLWPIDKIKV